MRSQRSNDEAAPARRRAAHSPANFPVRARLRRAGAALAALSALSALAACSRGPKVDDEPRPGSAPGSRGGRGEPVALVDPTRIYAQNGFLAGGAALPYVGHVAYLAGPTPDSTLALVSISLPNRALTFGREADRFKATYDVRLDLRQGQSLVRHVESTETVRVNSYKETARGDESVVFQQSVMLAPGAYDLTAAVRDDGGSGSSSQEAKLTVPRLAAGSMSSPVVVFRATPRESVGATPDVVASPRATATFGRDTLLPVYVEAYGGAAPANVHLTVLGDGGAPLWADTVSLTARRNGLFSAVVDVPVSRLGVGVSTLVTSRVASRGAGASAADSTRTPLFVTFGDELPVASFEEMLNYLRYYASAPRLQALRETPPAQRPAAWGAFLRETDPVISTPQHEGLRDYFARLQQANERFRGDGAAGWMSDRGMVFITLGEPDQIYEQGGSNDLSSRGRALIWEYRNPHMQLVFIDQTGFNRWRLTSGSENDFQAAARRVQK